VLGVNPKALGDATHTFASQFISAILGVGGLEGGPKPPSQTERAIERRRGSARAHANDVNNIAALGSGSPIAVGFYCAVRHSTPIAGRARSHNRYRRET
jgi:hypothetical protein